MISCHILLLIWPLENFPENLTILETVLTHSRQLLFLDLCAKENFLSIFQFVNLLTLST